MDIIIRPAENSDFDSVVHIMNQVQALHVNWLALIFTKKVRIFSLWMLFQDALGRETFYVAAYEMYKKCGFTEKSINMELL